MLSSKPLGGSYKVKCTNKDGVVSYSKDIKTTDNFIFVKSNIEQGCEGLLDKLVIKSANLYPYSANGLSFYVDFDGVNYDPAPFEILSSDVTPLTGDDIKFNVTTPVPFGQTLFYDPVPFEFLKTYETKP